MNPTFHLCGPEDLTLLHTLSCRTFRETFAERNTAADLQAYLDRAYHPDKLRAELENKYTQFYFLLSGETPAGYIKLNEAPAQTEFQDPQSLEIERIYIARPYQGRGYGFRLIGHARACAQQRKKAYIWLGVWEQNEKAIAFYKRQGFYKIGTHAFVVGSDTQTDDIMRLDLLPGSREEPSG